jgi:hypothetical protein
MIPIASITASTSAIAITSVRGRRMPNTRSSEKRPGACERKSEGRHIGERQQGILLMKGKLADEDLSFL